MMPEAGATRRYDVLALPLHPMDFAREGTQVSDVMTPNTEFDRGITLFNAANYFDAHEVWEDVWRAVPAAEKKFLQGLIQIAVALHHHSRGNIEGTKSLLARAQRNLAGYPDSYGGVNLASVRLAVAGAEEALRAAAPLPPFKIFRG